MTENFTDRESKSLFIQQSENVNKESVVYIGENKPVSNAAAHAMTLDEAIEHAEDVADRCDTSCGREHRQLADWLKELRDVKGQPVGNAAVMREALEKVAVSSEYALKHDDLDCGDLRGFIEEMGQDARAARSAPARNCDVGTAEEQAMRFRDMCNKYYDDENPCNKKCPMAAFDIMHGWPRCQSYWAQMPYEAERKGE